MTFEGSKYTVITQEASGINAMYLTEKSSGDSDFFLYNSDDGSFSPFEEVEIAKDRYIIPLMNDGKLKLSSRYQKTTLTLNGKEFDTWQDTKDAEYYIVYALNSDGEKTTYRYDTTDGTYQKYSPESQGTTSGNKNNGKGLWGKILNFVEEFLDIVVIIAIALFLLVLLMFIVTAIKLRHRDLELGDLYDEYGIDMDEEEAVLKEKKKEEKKVLIIDEINRAPLASVLGELIYGLEYRGKNIYTPYVIRDESGKEKPLNIPDNLFIIGTMNTADRSIGSIDYAVRRRFAFISVPANADIIKSTWDDEKIGEEAENLYKALLEGGEQIEGKQTKGIFDEEYLEDTEIDVEDIKIGHSYFLGENKSKEENDENDYLSYRIKYQVFPIYKEYIKDGIIKKSGEKNFKDICKHHNIDL